MYLSRIFVFNNIIITNFSNKLSYTFYYEFIRLFKVGTHATTIKYMVKPAEALIKISPLIRYTEDNRYIKASDNASTATIDYCCVPGHDGTTKSH